MGVLPRLVVVVSLIALSASPGCLQRVLQADEYPPRAAFQFRPTDRGPVVNLTEDDLETFPEIDAAYELYLQGEAGQPISIFYRYFEPDRGRLIVTTLQDRLPSHPTWWDDNIVVVRMPSNATTYGLTNVIVEPH
ncbi:MAG TPA: hypothetical protein VI997_00175 [Candidatus Thermoplasmatota archaeon]|nr:hypothetical protein [Candidatus Thermoplasmatota archaeon]